MRRSGGLFLLVVAALLTAALAPAQRAEAADPESSIRAGLRLRREGRDEEALREFRAAYEAAPTPRAVAQMGLAEQALGRWVDAETHLRAALDASSDKWIIQNRAYLDKAMAAVREHVGALEVAGLPAGAEVHVGAERIGRLPFWEPVSLLAGEIELRISAPGHGPLTRRVTIRAGTTTRETVELVPLAAAAADRAASSMPGASRQSGPPDGAPPAEVRNSRSVDRRRARIVGWTFIAAGAAVAAAGAALHLSSWEADGSSLVTGLMMGVGAGAVLGGVADLVLLAWVLPDHKAARGGGVALSLRR